MAGVRLFINLRLLKFGCQEGEVNVSQNKVGI
jgi:hypothetical protein